MRIRVRYYGNVRQALETDGTDLSFGDEVTVADVLDRLTSDNESLADLTETENVIVMRNGTHLDAGTAVTDGDVLRLSTSPMPE